MYVGAASQAGCVRLVLVFACVLGLVWFFVFCLSAYEVVKFLVAFSCFSCFRFV